MRKLSPWANTVETDWNAKILDYLAWLGEMFKVTAATTRRKMSAVRYIRLAAGLADFSKCGVRYKMLIRAYSMKRPVSRKLPFNMDLVALIQQQFGDQQEQKKTKEAWEALVLSSFFCMGTSEMGNLRHRDAILGGKDAEAVITLFSQKSKPGQMAVGCFRSLSETQWKICPIAAMIPWLNEINWGPKSRGEIPTDDISTRLSTLIKWTANAHGLPTDRFATHSLRSGGASAMFVAGVNIRDIKRFGRWSANTVEIYLFHDDTTYKGVGGRMVESTGLLQELKQAVDTR